MIYRYWFMEIHSMSNRKSETNNKKNHTGSPYRFFENMTIPMPTAQLIAQRRKAEVEVAFQKD